MRECLKRHAFWLTVLQIFVALFLAASHYAFHHVLVDGMPYFVLFLAAAFWVGGGFVCIMGAASGIEVLKKMSEPVFDFLAMGTSIVAALFLFWEYHPVAVLMVTLLVVFLLWVKTVVEAKQEHGKMIALWGFHLVTPLTIGVMTWLALTWPFISAQLVIICATLGISTIWYFARRPHWFEKIPSSFPSFM